jgi:hypothetical protein
MPMIEAQCASILVLHDHRHINHERKRLSVMRQDREFCMRLPDRTGRCSRAEPSAAPTSPSPPRKVARAGRAGRALSIPHSTAGVGYRSRTAVVNGAKADGRDKLPRRQARLRTEQYLFRRNVMLGSGHGVSSGL